jgi:hypothetical protein
MSSLSNAPVDEWLPIYKGAHQTEMHPRHSIPISLLLLE